MLDIKNCSEAVWYDITDIETGKKGMNTKVCVNLECKNKECRSWERRIVTSEGYPFYDPTGEKANCPPIPMIFND